MCSKAIVGNKKIVIMHPLVNATLIASFRKQVISFVQPQKTRSMMINTFNKFPVCPHISLYFFYSARFVQKWYSLTLCHTWADILWIQMPHKFQVYCEVFKSLDKIYIQFTPSLYMIKWISSKIQTKLAFHPQTTRLQE